MLLSSLQHLPAMPPPYLHHQLALQHRWLSTLQPAGLRCTTRNGRSLQLLQGIRLAGIKLVGMELGNTMAVRDVTLGRVRCRSCDAGDVVSCVVTGAIMHLLIVIPHLTLVVVR